MVKFTSWILAQKQSCGAKFVSVGSWFMAEMTPRNTRKNITVSNKKGICLGPDNMKFVKLVYIEAV